MSNNVLSAFEILLTEIQIAREQIADALKQASPTDTKRLLRHIGQIVEIADEIQSLRQRWTRLDEPEPAIEDSEIPFPPLMSEEEERDDSEADSPPDDDEIDESTAKGMFGERPPTVKRRPIKRGQCTPQGAYRLPILEVLCELDGAAPRKDVLSGVFSKMKERLLPEDKEKVPSGRAIRWENLASFERKKMVQEGLLADNTPRIWQITEAGRAYLQRMRDGGGDK